MTSLLGATPPPPVFRHWYACTSSNPDPAFTRSQPAVSNNRQVPEATAAVPAGAPLGLAGQVHRATRIDGPARRAGPSMSDTASEPFA